MLNSNLTALPGHPQGAGDGSFSKKEVSGAGRKPQHRARGRCLSPPKTIEIARKLASSGDSSEPVNRRPAPSELSEPLPASVSAATDEQTVAYNRQLGPPKGVGSYAAVLDGPVPPFQPSGSLKPTDMDSDISEPADSPETANRRMSNDMSGPLSDKPDGTTKHPQVANTCLPAGDRPNKKSIFI